MLESTPFSFGAGVVAEVFANVAEFTTNVTGPALSTNQNSNSNGGRCDLEVVQGYQFALGAAAGATVAIGFNTWGPMPATTVPIFYTTLASACAARKPSSPPTVLAAVPSTTDEPETKTTTAKATTRATTTTTARISSSTTTRKSSSSSSTAKTTAKTTSTTAKTTTAKTTSTARTTQENDRRQNQNTQPATRTTAAGTGLRTTTLLSTKVFTAQTCLSTGLINCPASLQASSTYKSVMTLITVLAAGAPSPTFPETKFASVLNTVTFGSAAQKMVSTSGSPTSFVPGATDAAGSNGNWLEGNSGGVSNKIILGVSVGVGALVLLFLGNWVL